MPEEAYIDGLGQLYATLGHLDLAGLRVQGFKLEGSGLYIYIYTYKHTYTYTYIISDFEIYGRC